MFIREASYSDIDMIVELYDAAREYFAQAGINQWQNGEPDINTAFAAVDDGICYCVTEEGEILATFVCDFSGEPAYDRIFDGEWLNGDEYAALHLVAVKNERRGRGIGGEIVGFVERRCRENCVANIRCDTHPDNAPMRRMLEKNGFEFCGTVRYTGEGERVAYQKIVK